MCPLLISDFPEQVRENLVDFIVSLELVPLNVFNVYEYECSWSYFTDSDRLSFLAWRLNGSPEWSRPSVLSPFEPAPKRSYVKPVCVETTFQQLSLFNG